MFSKIWTSFKSRKWYHITDLISENYNTKVHSTTRQTPDDVWEGKAAPHNKADFKPRRIASADSLQVGTLVRLKKPKAQWQKEGKAWTKGLFEVTERIGNRYRVVSMKSGQEVQTKYREYDLQRVEDALIQRPPLVENVPAKVIRQRNDVIRGVAKQRKVNRVLQREQISAKNVTEGTRDRKPRQILDL